MPLITRSHRPAAAAALMLLLASLTLAACGGSSGSTSTAKTSANASASTSTSTSTSKTPTTSRPSGTPQAGRPPQLAGRFTALRECLAKNGITLPKFKPGQRPAPGSGGFLGGGRGAQLPKGMTEKQYEAILTKCGGGLIRGGGFGGIGSRFSGPAFKRALAKFATCMRENGVKLPTPNTSGKGPVFGTKGLSTTSQQFRSAEAKCRVDLGGAFGARPSIRRRAPGTSTG